MTRSLTAAGVRPTSRWLYRTFAVIARRRLRKHFRAVRLANAERLDGLHGPLMFYINHASWWDPLVCIQVQRKLLRREHHYAPMDAAAMRQYGFFARIGVFPVDGTTARGAAQFLRGAEAILAHGGVLWVTPQGEFVDVRRRPLVLKGGLGALLHRLPEATVVPLAIEYTFWDQRLPEVLLSVGEPIAVKNGRAATAQSWTEHLTQALTRAEDELAALGMVRDAKRFRTILHGRRGTAGFYGLWQRVRARMRGEPFMADHAVREVPAGPALVREQNEVERPC